MEMAQGQLGPEAKYNFKFESGKLVAVLAYDGAELDIELAVKYDALAIVDALINAVEKAVPGDQSAMAAMLKAVVKGAVA
jgi:hypothetical protein